MSRIKNDICNKCFAENIHNANKSSINIKRCVKYIINAMCMYIILMKIIIMLCGKVSNSK